MRSILWVDDDLDDFPAVRRIITKKGWSPNEAYTVAQAVEWLRKVNPSLPAAMILDAIVPLGGRREDFASAKKEMPSRYTGLIILEMFPELASRTIVLSVVPKKTLVDAGLHANVTVISKLDLAMEFKHFRERLDSIVAASNGSSHA